MNTMFGMECDDAMNDVDDDEQGFTRVVGIFSVR